MERLPKFQKKMRWIVEGVDLKRTKQALKVSRDNGSGQSNRVFKMVKTDAEYHLSPLLQLPEVPRFALAKFIQTVAGCDFLTPHNFSNKPKCRFCDDSTADWCHLLLKCPNYDSGIIDKMKN